MTRTAKESWDGLDSDARDVVKRAVLHDPAWQADGEDPWPAIRARTAGLVTLDVFAVTATTAGRTAVASAPWHCRCRAGNIPARLSRCDRCGSERESAEVDSKGRLLSEHGGGS